MAGIVLIETEAHVATGVRWLAEREPRFAHAASVVGEVPLRRRPGGFPALLRAICGQQLSVASAQAVWTRLETADCCHAAGIAMADDDVLRACGLSRQKIAYARALAEADLDFHALSTMPEDEAIAALTAVKGIGVWTAEIYLMFAVGRPDVFAPGDLALQEGARILFELAERPKEKAFREMAAAWSPWRAVAARLLWAYYAVEKSREGVDP